MKTHFLYHRCGFKPSKNISGLAPFLLILLLLALSACHKTDTPQAAKPVEETKVEGITKEYERGPVKVRLLVDKKEITLARNLNLTLEADVKEGYEVQLPAFGDKLGQFGIVDYREEPPKLTDEGKIRTRKIYELEPFLSGDYKIAPMKVTFRAKPSQDDNATATPEKHEIETEEVTIKVSSLLGDDRNKLMQVRPIFGPEDLPAPPIPKIYLFIGVAIFLLAGGMFFFWYRRGRQRSEEAIRRIPAHETAYRQIQEILDENLLDRGEIKLFYAKISDVIRHYIENRFGLHAPKCTTEEFLSKISRSSPFSPEHQRLLDDFLRHCDLVKFAEHQPTAEEIQKTFNACKAFIEATKQEEPTQENQGLKGTNQGAET